MKFIVDSKSPLGSACWSSLFERPRCLTRSGNHPQIDDLINMPEFESPDQDMMIQHLTSLVICEISASRFRLLDAFGGYGGIPDVRNMLARWSGVLLRDRTLWTCAHQNTI